jgi:putative membrane protein
MFKAILLTSVLSIAALGALTSPVTAREGTGSQGSPPAPAAGPSLAKEDKSFVDEAATGGLLEVRLGQLAVKHAGSEDVKAFGQRMIDDHAKINARVAQIAQQKGITVPLELDKKHQAEIDRLSKLSGAKFDHEYMSHMIDEHTRDVKAFEKEAKEAKDPDVKDLAATTLPTLHEHLTMAKQIQDKLKK